MAHTVPVKEDSELGNDPPDQQKVYLQLCIVEIITGHIQHLININVPHILFLRKFRVTSLTFSFGKLMPTRKLAVQLEHPATAMAAGRGPWEKSSATINQGIGPGPISNIATKAKMAAMLT